MVEPRQEQAGRTGEVLVRIEHLSKTFGSFVALDDVSLDVSKGEVVVVVGASGSGKSTLCRCINRMEKHTGGTITIDGVPLPEEGRALARLRADVGMVFQSFNLFGHLSALDNVMLGPVRVHGMSKAAARQEAMDLLQRVGIGDKAASLPARCPAASSSGWPSPGRWPCTRRSCCSTSRPAPWIRKWSARCWM